MRTLACSLLSLSLFVGCPGEAPTADGSDPAARAVFVVRHAESWKNVDAPADMPPEQRDTLTPRGQEQARALGVWLSEQGVEAILTSPAGRTRETAAIIAEVSGVPAREAPALAPLKEGRTPAGAPTPWSWREEQWRAGEDPTPEGGESLADGARRALEAIARTPTEGALVLVTHGDVAAGLLGHAAHTPLPERWARHEQPGGTVTELRVAADGTWTLGERWTPPATAPSPAGE